VSDAASDNIELLRRALDQMGEVIAAVGPDQATLPTPCSGWVVQDLVRHVMGQSLRNFTVAARGEMADWGAPADDPGEDWAGSFRRQAQHLLEVWRQADVDRPVPMPGGAEAPLRSRADQQITELAVHSWDLARATGQERELDPALAEYGLAWSRRMLRPEHRGSDKAFGAEVPVDEGAPAYDRLVGWFGRDPAWRPPAG
jgi:uncharacterized protein (TIGR03086 family)